MNDTSVGYVYFSCTGLSSRLECNSLFVGLEGWGVRGNERKNRSFKHAA